MKRALIDLSSVVWTCLMAGKDAEFGKSVVVGEKTYHVNSAAYGYENCMEHLRIVMDDLRIVPRQMIFVMEGKDSKAIRQFIHPGYKASGREKIEAQYEAFNDCKAMLLEAFLDAGAQMVTQDGVEADDVIGYLAKHLQGERWIVSGDKDLAQCIGGDVHHWRSGARDKNPFGDFPYALIPVYIALVGDASDKIPGAKGFGQAAMENLLMVFGDEGLVALKDLIVTKQLLRLQEDVGELKQLQKVIDDAPNVYMSYDLACLKLDKVNTLRRPLQWRAGMVKPRSTCKEERLRKYRGEVWLVSQENYKDALAFFIKHSQHTPEYALDIETSTPPESDEWLARLGKSEDRTPVDVFGSKLTGMGLTFGANMQYTFYMTVDHLPEPGVTNLTIDEVRNLLDNIPAYRHIQVHNGAFELPICKQTFGERWANNGWHGFLPNVVDTAIMSSYADENRSAGLKSLSKEVLSYEQDTYQQVTTKGYQRAQWGGKGSVIGEWTDMLMADGEVSVDEDHPGTPWVKVQHKMNELTAKHVLSYGADDPICTSALANHFRAVMEIEHTWDVFMEVEQLPAYVQAQGFLDGVEFSLESMREMEKKDDVKHAAAWVTLREYLMKIGFEGTRFQPITELTPTEIKAAYRTLHGLDLMNPAGDKVTQVKLADKLAKLIEDQAPDSLLPHLIREGNVAAINELLEAEFSGEPKLDLGSSKQMTGLLYDIMGLPVHIVNDPTDLQKQKDPNLGSAIRRFKQMRSGKEGIELSPEELALVRSKAKADDTAVEFALAFDADQIDDEARAALRAIQTMKTVGTRRSLFYKNYWGARHWEDGRVHPQVRQCGTVTRRPTGSNPNVYQLPKHGEGVEFRSHFLPHCKDGVVVSIDFNGQELRLAAERSQDANLLACYVGDNLKDVHSTTAAGAMRLKWGTKVVDGLFDTYGTDLPRTTAGEYALFLRLRKLPKSDPWQKKADDLRKDSKNVNFTAQFGGKELKISERLIMPVSDARIFLDARSAMFPGVDRAAARAEDECKRTGMAKTLMGAVRHLRAGIISDDNWEVSRAARQAWNFEIQSSAAEMTKLAMKRLWESGALLRLNMRFFASIYDELVFTVSREHAVEAIRIVNWCMTQPYSTMTVPILGSISLGPNFAEQQECGDWFILENVQKALGLALTEAA